MRREREKADKRQRNYITIGIVVVVLALIAGASYAISNTSNANKRATKYVAPKNTTKDFGILYDTETATGKAAGDPVTITMYEDFQCPACKSFEDANGAFLGQAVTAGDITIDYRPISFLDSKVTDDYSSRASNAALCVLDSTDVKTYATMHDLLFARQSPESGPGLDDAEIAAIAKEAGAADVKTCIKSRKFDPWLRKATKASSDDVKATPTIMIGDKKIEGTGGNLPTPQDLAKAIAEAKKA